MWNLHNPYRLPEKKKPPLSGTVESGGRNAFYVGTGGNIGKRQDPVYGQDRQCRTLSDHKLGQLIWFTAQNAAGS